MTWAANKPWKVTRIMAITAEFVLWYLGRHKKGHDDQIWLPFALPGVLVNGDDVSSVAI